MPYVVVLGGFQGIPDTIVGPFETLEDAHTCALAQPGDPEGRFAAVLPLTPPDSA